MEKESIVPEEVIEVSYDSSYYAVDIAEAIESMFATALDMYKEHNPDAEFNSRWVTVSVCEEGSGICGAAKIKVDKRVPRSTVEEEIKNIVQALDTLLPEPM